jgi:hypothetical protein
MKAADRGDLIMRIHIQMHCKPELPFVVFHPIAIAVEFSNCEIA